MAIQSAAALTGLAKEAAGQHIRKTTEEPEKMVVGVGSAGRQRGESSGGEVEKEKEAEQQKKTTVGAVRTGKNFGAENTSFVPRFGLHRNEKHKYRFSQLGTIS